jgi:mortality factor 4-like protein 1
MEVEDASIDQEKNTMNDDFESTPLLPPFQVNDKVQSRDDNGSIWYDAVVKKIKYDSLQQQWQFLIHYQGWNSRYDQWHAPDSIRIPLPLDANDNAAVDAANDVSATNLSVAPQNDTALRKRHANNSPQPPSAELSPRKRRSPYTQYCALPFTLKTVLVDEWDCLHRSRLLHVLPSPVPIRKVLQHFLKKKSNSDTEMMMAFERGLTDLFSSALPTILLYPLEKSQYHTVVVPLLTPEEGKKPLELLDIYGCEFLLRLYVRLPTLLAQVPPPSKNSASRGGEKALSSPQKLGPLLQELLVLMQKNRTTLFTAASYKYRPA